jgi:hypothetical protein
MHINHPSPSSERVREVGLNSAYLSELLDTVQSAAALRSLEHLGR